MQTLNIDGTTYTLKFDKCPIAWAKLARKAYRPAKPKDLRKFPKNVSVTMSTGDYIRQFEKLNMLQAVEYTNLNYTSTAYYDPSLPLVEVFND